MADEKTERKVAYAIFECFADKPSQASFDASPDMWLRAAKAAIAAQAPPADGTRTCAACVGEGKVVDRMCVPCDGTGRVPV